MMLYAIIVAVVGGMLLYELYTGEALVKGTRSITRLENSFRYWFWNIFSRGNIICFDFCLGVWRQI